MIGGRGQDHRQRLGWLDAPTHFPEEVDELEAFARGVHEDFTHAVVCGMGGSSLAPDVLAHAFPRSEHGLYVEVLDSTDPDAVPRPGPGRRTRSP